MNAILKTVLAVAALAVSAQAAAQITFYENENFQGRTFTMKQRVQDFRSVGFNDRASSAVALRDRWEVCEDIQFRGRCVVLHPGDYPSLAAMGLNRISSVRIVASNARIDDSRYAAAPLKSQITFYERERFGGRSFITERPIRNFQRFGFDKLASSAVVLGDRWEACDAASFKGRCVVLRPGRYPSLEAMGLNDQVSSVRTISSNAHVDDNRYAPAPVAAYDARRRRNERLYEAKVTSVRAVVGTPEQRCWIEREQVAQNQGPIDLAAAIAGILGYQTEAAAPVYQDVQRCASVPNQKPDHWDVTYTFRGEQYRIQTIAAPGSTITVNSKGEPRG